MTKLWMRYTRVELLSERTLTQPDRKFSELNLSGAQPGQAIFAGTPLGMIAKLAGVRGDVLSMGKARLVQSAIPYPIPEIGFESPPWRIDFVVPFSRDSDSATAEIVIWNMSRETAKKIKKGQRIRVMSGYRERYDVIFDGEIVDSNAEIHPPDRVVKIIAQTHSDPWLGITAWGTWPPGTPASTVAMDLIAQTGLTVGAFEPGREWVYERGYYVAPHTVIGGRDGALAHVAQDLLADVYVLNGKVYLVNKKWGFTIPTIAAPYPDGVLIGSPERVEGQWAGSVSDRNEGDFASWGVKVFLDHRVEPNARMRVRSESLSGIIKVIQGKHVSNYNDHYTYVLCAVVRTEEELTRPSTHVHIPSPVIEPPWVQYRRQQREEQNLVK